MIDNPNRKYPMVREKIMIGKYESTLERYMTSQEQYEFDHRDEYIQYDEVKEIDNNTIGLNESNS